MAVSNDFHAEQSRNHCTLQSHCFRRFGNRVKFVSF